MADAPLAFHAVPPPGEWINDPNGLVFADGAYRLFVQHRADAPDFRETGWARLTSPDLLFWCFDGPVIAPGADWAYSGSVVAEGEMLAAFHTAHADKMERQVRRLSQNGGRSWSALEELPSLGAPRANQRDPYVFHDGTGWVCLLAAPCDWTDWRNASPSKLLIFRSEDGCSWRPAGAIGPWRPGGVMWEVPLIVRIAGHDVLLLSEIDRRNEGAACSVRGWIGTLTDSGFEPLPDAPAEGQLIDHGPDFYAAMASVEQGWPRNQRAFVGWLSNWDTARTMAWPGFHGGPISLPRSLGIEQRGDRTVIACRPLSGISQAFAASVAEPPRSGLGQIGLRGQSLILSCRSALASVHIAIDWQGGQLDVTREGGLPCRRRSRFDPAGMLLRTLEFYVDGPVLELFLIEDGVSLSIAMETGGAALQVAAEVDGVPVPISWTTLAV